jgi:hypothetical protein
MTKKELRNVAASVHQRLRNLAAKAQGDAGYLLQRYAAERFLYRLGISSEVDRFTLKGASLFLVWARREFRATNDLDFLGHGSADPAALRHAIEVICSTPYPDDGVRFDRATIRLEQILAEQEYGGVRIKLEASLGVARVDLRLDIGFGDAVTPDRLEAEYPALLDLPAPRLWTYPRETSIAEKFEAMVRLSARNTRVKDFWDIAVLADHFDFDGETLRTAIAETFTRRRTAIEAEMPEALRPEFYANAERLRLWGALQSRVGAGIRAPARFEEAGERVRAFLGPMRESLVLREAFTLMWSAGGPWLKGSNLVQNDD